MSVETFEHAVDRSNDHSAKFHAGYMENDPSILPMWVADMDFAAPDSVRQALKERAEFGVFGYTAPWDGVLDAAVNWMKRRHQTEIEKEWIVSVPGIVPALKIMIQALSKPGDSILIFTPVYYPFKASILEEERTAVESPLHFENGAYSIDFEDAEKKIRESSVKMIIFCSPHNPTGNVWSKEDVARLSKIARENNVILISDEIHMDFDHSIKHTPLFLADPLSKDTSIIATAPSKTFNLAGLQVSFLYVPNPKFREKIRKTMSVCGMSDPNIMGLTAAQAAYETGDKWVDGLKERVKNNAEFTDVWLKENLPQIHLVKPEGLYLFWIDFRALNMRDDELMDFLIQEAKVWLNPGIKFGKEGSGFMRMNAGTSQDVILEALTRIKNAINAREAAKHE